MVVQHARSAARASASASGVLSRWQTGQSEFEFQARISVVNCSTPSSGVGLKWWSLPQLECCSSSIRPYIYCARDDSKCSAVRALMCDLHTSMMQAPYRQDPPPLHLDFNCGRVFAFPSCNGAVRIRHSIREIATQPVILWIYRWVATKMASIELWIQWCNAHGPHGACKWWRHKTKQRVATVKIGSKQRKRPIQKHAGRRVSHLATWSSLFLRRKVRTVLATPSLLSAAHFKRYWGSDKCGAVFRSIDDLTAWFCMGCYLCLEPILPVATPVAGLWRSTCKPYWSRKVFPW